MCTLALVLALATAAPARASEADADRAASGAARATSALLAGTRVVARYLDAVRLSAPSPAASRPARVLPAREDDYGPAKALTAPRTLEAIRERLARGGAHDMAPWVRADRDRFLESFDLLGTRRAPRGSVVVTVRERFYVVGEGGERLAELVSEYLAARVGGAWRVVDRRAGGRFTDAAIDAEYAGYWDG
jgi:hypothetical protein